MNVYLDFETYYAKDYTLKKMSIEEYVRDPRFTVQLLCVAVNDGPVYTVWPKNIPTVLQLLNLGDPNTMTWFHNGRFDGFIITQHYGFRIHNPECTRCLGRYAGLSRIARESLSAQSEVLGTGDKGGFLKNMEGRHLSSLTAVERDEFAAYCQQDVALLRRNVKAMAPFLSPGSLLFVGMSLNMYLNPVFVLDSVLLSDYMEKLKRAQEETRERLSRMFAFDSTEAFMKALRSKSQFCNMLTKLGGAVPMKLSAKQTETNRKKYEALLPDPEAQKALDTRSYEVYVPALAKSDPDFLKLMESENQDIAELARARAELNSSMAMSRASTFLAIAKRGTLPVALEPYLAHTGRYSAGTSDGVKSDSINLQNLNKRGADKTLRQAVKTPKGRALVACDSSQIEARVLAWVAGEDWLLQSFKDKEDPYSQMASAIYGEDYATIKEWTKGASAHDPNADKATKAKFKQYRNVGKTAVLQLGYYAGAAKFALYLTQQGIHLADTDEDHLAEAKRIVNVYRNRNSAIRAFWKKAEGVIDMMLAGVNGVFGGPNGDTFEYFGTFERFGRNMPNVMLPDGYRLFYPDLRVAVIDGKPEVVYTLIDKGRPILKRLHSGVLTNNLCQGLAFAIIREQALRINTMYPVRINIHDSLGVLCEDSPDAIQTCRTTMETVMAQAPSWAPGLPLACESEVGHDFTVA